MHKSINIQSDSLSVFPENKNIFRTAILSSGIAAAIAFAGPVTASYNMATLFHETVSMHSLSTELPANVLARAGSEQLVVARRGQSFIPIGRCTKRQEKKGKCKR